MLGSPDQDLAYLGTAMLAAFVDCFPNDEVVGVAAEVNVGCEEIAEIHAGYSWGTRVAETAVTETAATCDSEVQMRTDCLLE